MSLKIDLPNSYEFSVRNRNSEILELELPSIKLIPVDIPNNIPHIIGITYLVKGDNKKLVNQLKSVYQNIDLEKPLKLFNISVVKYNKCQIVTSLQSNEICILKINIKYYDSNSGGTPNLNSVNEVSKSCSLKFKFMKNNLQGHPATPENEPKPGSKPSYSHPGWLAIDFGTSNSTITLYEPNKLDLSYFPQEQAEEISKLFVRWLTDDNSDVLAGSLNKEWKDFVEEINNKFNFKANSINSFFSEQQGRRTLVEIIHETEKILRTRSEQFRKIVNVQLNQIYHKAFRVPPLKHQGFIPIKLDLLRQKQAIPSELEIINLEPLKVYIGNIVTQHKNEAIKSSENINWDETLSKFHHSPKRYLGAEKKEILITLNNEKKQVPINRLIQESLAKLIELTEDSREASPDKFSSGSFNHAIVTYPAISSPLVRKELESLVRTLGIDKVEMTYDEAVSVAIFFLWREFGGDLNIGLESFKTRCRQIGNNKWTQNVLVLDIGGGTTDIALISLTLEEKDPFEENEDRGKGGRYYVLTPKFKGSSGNLNLGGELITLKIFLLLKAAIADSILTAVSNERLQNSALKARISELDLRFKDGQKFRSGSILKCVDREIENYPDGDRAYQDGIDAAEKIISTRWENNPARLQTFYTLWDIAEDAKCKLGEKTPEVNTFDISWHDILPLLQDKNITDDIELTITINTDQFERAVIPTISKAINIAKGLVESRFQNTDASEIQQQPSNQGNFVDWLILSGQTCKLYLVEREINREFSKSEYFVYNPERITFVSEYSKLATSVGACYAEKLRQMTYNPSGSKDLLRRGANQLNFKIKNLCLDLPCSFYLSTSQGGNKTIEIFNFGDKLYQSKARNIKSGNNQERIVFKTQNNPLPVALSMFIYREDFQGNKPLYWGKFDGQTLAKKLYMAETKFQNKIQIIFEVDSKLTFNLMVFNSVAYREVTADIPSISLKEALSSEDDFPILSNDNRLAYNIAIDIEESVAVHAHNGHNVLFEAEKDYSELVENFRYSEEKDPESSIKRGLISNSITSFPRRGKHSFYWQKPNSTEWNRIGELSLPDIETDYPCRYYVTLDELGNIRLYFGEVPYWTSEDYNCLQKEGCMFITTPELRLQNEDKRLNPFSGIH